MAGEEVQQQAVDPLRAFALQPVAAAGQQVLFQARYPPGHACQGRRLEAADRVALAEQEQGGLLHLQSGQRFATLPVAFEVAVPVQRAVEAAPGAAFDLYVGEQSMEAIALTEGVQFLHAAGTVVAQDAVVHEVAQTRPLSVLMAEQVQALRDWARGRTVPAD